MSTSGPPNLNNISTQIINGQIKNIVILVGAGISTAAGIPDFRSRSSGIYDNLEEFRLPDPMAVFSLDYFKTDPRPFFEIARRLYTPNIKPTLTHYFIRLLNDKGVLRRHYTQNVDNLERLSGLAEGKFVEAHGTFHTGHCMSCKTEHSFDYMRDRIVSKTVPLCSNETCGGVVKPDVVLFGENLPSNFYQNLSSDFSACDLLLVIGTSLQVQPFCSLIHRVRGSVPRFYLNREFSPNTQTGFWAFVMRFMVAGFRWNPFQWGQSGNRRDVFVQGDADDSVLQLAKLLGWKDELLTLKSKHDAYLDAVQNDTLSTKNTPR